MRINRIPNFIAHFDFLSVLPVGLIVFGNSVTVMQVGNTTAIYIAQGPDR
jgi:hypothetical protein